MENLTPLWKIELYIVTSDKSLELLQPRHYFFTHSEDTAKEACNLIAYYYRVKRSLRKEDLLADVTQYPAFGTFVTKRTYRNNLEKLWERYGIPAQPPPT